MDRGNGGPWEWRTPGMAGRYRVCTHQCPVCAHQCPVSAHQCPVCAHQCPVCAHQCPVSAHQCLVCAYQCPVRAHQCPVCTHQCPVCAHQCPVRPHQCRFTCPWQFISGSCWDVPLGMHAIFEVRICSHFGAISIYRPNMLGSRDPGHTEFSKN